PHLPLRRSSDLAPVTSTVGKTGVPSAQVGREAPPDEAGGAARSVMALDRHRSRFAAADAQRGYALLQVVLPHGIDERRDDPRTRRTDRMAERARTTVNVHLVGRSEERRVGKERRGPR